MRRNLAVLIMILVAMTLCSCGEDKCTDSDCPEGLQFVFVWGEHDDDWWDSGGMGRVYEPNTEVWGGIVGDPLPRFEYFEAGGIRFSGRSFHEYNEQGVIAFSTSGEQPYEEWPPLTSDYDPLNVEVKTSYGTISGTVPLPDTVVNLTLSVEDTLELGQPLTVSWDSNSDFFRIGLEYAWSDPGDGVGYTFIDTFVTVNSIEYEGSIFSRDGLITEIFIQPISGVFPEAGAEGNMTGYGSGFIYYRSEPAEAVHDEGIWVGSGFPLGPAMMSAQRRSGVKFREETRLRVERMLLER